MTAEELMALATRSAEDATRVSLAALNGQIDAAERIAARQISDRVAEAGVRILARPTT